MPARARKKKCGAGRNAASYKGLYAQHTPGNTREQGPDGRRTTGKIPGHHPGIFPDSRKLLKMKALEAGQFRENFSTVQRTVRHGFC
jgi:hypothetical protein